MSQSDPDGHRRSGAAHALDGVVEQRYAGALAVVADVREAHPDESPDQLANRLIRRYAKDLAMGGALAGGAAAAPVAGVAVAAASIGVESAFGVGRLSEMIMAIGVLYGHSPTSPDDRRTAVLAVLGMADGAAIGMSGLAARAGTRGSARLIRRLTASGAAGASAAATKTGRRSASLARAMSRKGPWSAAALVPYGIGAGVGAAGNALLTRAVGKAAKEYYAANQRWPAPGAAGSPTADDRIDDEIVDAVIVESVATESIVVESIMFEDEIVDAEVVDPTSTD